MVLKLELSSAEVTGAASDVLVVGVFQGQLAKDATFRAIEKALGGGLIDHAKAVEFEGKADQTLDVATLGRLKSQRVLFIGAGEPSKFDDARARAFIASAVRGAQGPQVRHIALSLPGEVSSPRVIGEGVGLGVYRFAKYFTGERKPKAEIGKVTVFCRRKITPADKRSAELGLRVADAVALARDAVNEPPNVLIPDTLAQIARRIAREQKLKIKVLDKKGILAAKMNLHYAVGQGSENEPRFIHLSYVPRKKKKKLVFVGKGLTFDSGGLCIKPAPGMGDMKSDMAGAAAVLGLMLAVGEVRPDVEVHGIVGAAENMPDGAAYRPADVFTSLDGKTVEIINTDAEGRLVLADALSYASRLKPDLIVDAATLTGAALVALGKTCSAFYATADDLATKLESASREAGESFWRMPLLDELGEQLKSDVADLKHTGDRYGGSITAALFLREFTGGLPWIHCDIAGPVLADRAKGLYPKGATGHAVLTFLSFVEAAAR